MIALLLAVVIIDTTDPASYATPWLPVCGGIYETPWTKPVRLVVADSTERLYAHASLGNLGASNPVAGGWVQKPGFLYVRLPDGSSPAAHRMHISGPGSGLLVTVPGTVVESVTVRYVGDYGILVTAPDCTIRACTVENTGKPGILIDHPASRTKVEGCRMTDYRIATWPWAACKRHAEEIQGIKVMGGPGMVVEGCTITGYFDGIQGGSGVQPRSPGADTTAAELLVTGNLIHDVNDDGIEIETVDAVNVRVEGNTVQGCTNALSVAPIYRGPFYALNNRFLDYREGALKNFGMVPPADTACAGALYFVGNTCASLSGVYAGATGNGRDCGPGYFRNNIFYGHGTRQVNDHAPADYDYNLYWSTDDLSLIRWDGIGYYTLAAWTAATGQELHGLQADPLFVDPVHGDWTLRPESPARNAGVCLPEFGTPCSATMGAQP